MLIEPKPKDAQYNDEQWQAIQQTGSNLLVAASAGSGKTTVLIERILTHIRKKFAQIDELLVVTFTEAAAKEMKERMETKLKAVIYQPEYQDKQALFLEQIAKLPAAHIRTLHSFCLQVIQQFFYLIDFNPSFTLLVDETQKALIFQDVWEVLVADIIEGKVTGLDANDLQELLSRYANPRSDQDLFDLVLNLHLFSSSHPEPEIYLQNLSQYSRDFNQFSQTTLYKQQLAPNLQSNLQSAYQLLLKAENLLAGASDEIAQKYGDFLATEREMIGQLLDNLYQDQLANFANMLAGVEFKRWPSKPRKTEDGDLIDAMKAARDQAKTLITKNVQPVFPLAYPELEKVEAQLAPIIDKLSQLTLHFKQAVAQHKAKLNIIDYNDLEHLTLNILAPYNQQTGRREASIAATYYQNLFKEVMVDEYQDINEIQATILSWLSHEQRPDLTGNLFMVGDVKQSIYGFRMAEPSLFMEKYRRYQAHEDGELIVLDKNYRSRDEVLQFTNYVFERIMDEQFGEMNYGEQESLKKGNLSFEPVSPSPRFNIQLLLHEKTEGGDEAAATSFNEEATDTDELADELAFDSSIEAQAHLIAQDIRQKVLSKWQVYDKKAKGMRPVEYRDFVILSSTKKPFLEIQRAFQQYEIPINAQKIDTYFQRQEIQLMIALLKIIDNPRQDLPLVAILRSYFVGLSDEALSKIRIHHPSGTYYEAVLDYMTQVDDALADQLRQFNQQLVHWQTLASEKRLVELIWQIYQETYFLDYVTGLTNGAQRQANLHAFYQQAASFEKSNFKGVFGFIRYIEELTEHNQDIAEPVLLGDNEDYVRMMTVHGSKGLEFPIVYLMNIEKQFNMQDINHKRYVLSKNSGMGTDLYDFTTMLKYPSMVNKAIKIEKTMQAKAEEMRKLYVALTRCEQQLILVGTIDSQDKWQEKNEKTRELTDKQDKLVVLQERQAANSWLEWIRQSLAVPDTLAEKVTDFDIAQVDVIFRNQAEIFQTQGELIQQRQFIPEESWLDFTLKAIEEVSMDEPLSSLTQTMAALANPVYPYQLASHTSSYQSVSELKRLYEEPAHDQLSHFIDRTKAVNTETDHQLNLREGQLAATNNQSAASSATDVTEQEGIQSIRYTQDTFEPPQFMKPKTMTYAEIGSLTHFVMQHLAFDQYQGEAIDSWVASEISRLVSEEYLTQEEAALIKVETLVWFLKDPYGQQLFNHHQTLQREQAFSYLLPAKWLFKAQLNEDTMPQLADDQLLVHGIIDTFYETDDGLVILDYKTDRYRQYGNVPRSEQIELIADKYKFQLSLYAQALSQAKAKPVKDVCVVLLDFNVVYRYDELYTF